MKTVIFVLALAISCAVAKPRAAEVEPSTRHKYECYWFGCIWVPDWFPSPPFKCTSDGHFADRDDCGKYIVCQDSGDGFFIEHSMPCPNGLYFNPDTHHCDYPANVPSCSDRDMSKATKVIPSASLVEAIEAEIKPLLSNEHGSTRHKYECYWFGCIWVPDWFPSPAFECTSTGHFADRDDCGKYIVCQDAGDGFFIEHSMPCPNGLYFNPDTHHCDYPANVPSCSGKEMMEAAEVNPSSSLIEALKAEIKPLLSNEHGSTRHKYECYWFGCIWVPDWFPSPPFECTSTGHFADRDDCGKYIVCQDAGDGFFIEHSMPCPNGLYFNPDTHHCDYPANVPSCSGRDMTLAAEVNPSTSLVEALEAEITPLLSNEHGSTRHKFVCYWFGCIWVPDWFPSPPTVAPFECTSAGHFADRDDCGKYIVCQDAGDGFFIEHSMPCPNGLYFNPDTHHCDYPANVLSCSGRR